MKKYLYFPLVVFVFFFAQHSRAQVNMTINIGNQPIWGPVGYDYAEYYYLPDIDVYYYVPMQQYFYRSRNSWLSAPVLPPQYRNYDLYHAYKVVINSPKPYLNDAVNISRYSRYKGRHDQPFIRDSHDSRYYVISNHPEHNKWQGNNQQAGAARGSAAGQQRPYNAYENRANEQRPGGYGTEPRPDANRNTGQRPGTYGTEQRPAESRTTEQGRYPDNGRRSNEQRGDGR